MNLGLLAAGVGDVGGLLEGSEAGHAAKRLEKQESANQWCEEGEKDELMGVGVVVIAAMIVALIAPKTAHGLVAALVQVTNTAANPVPAVATDDLSTEPFSWESIASGTSGSYIRATAFTVPTTTEDGKIVKRLVWESASVTCRNLDEPFRGVRVVWQGPNITTNTSTSCRS